MSNDRREFLGRAAIGAATLAGLTAIPAHLAGALGVGPAGDVDTSWIQRVRGKYRAVFDVAEMDGAVGVWRSQLWGMQVQDVFKVKPDDIGTVLVLRHKAVSLAMQQQYWDTYAIGKALNVTHPVTQQPTDRNPALLAASRGEIDAKYDAFSLDKVIARETIVLGCTLALEASVVPRIAKADGVSTEEARKRAHALLVPGVIMQPSGIFAAIAAQEAGCHYVRAS